MTSAFHVSHAADDTLLVEFDVPGSKVNTLSRAVLAELAQHLSQLRDRDDLEGLIFRSRKPGQFIAGADLRELAQLPLATPKEIKELTSLGQSLFDQISKLPFPTIALIDGACMGGGTELVLAFDERIASSDGGTSIGLPETKLGILPGWGGTQRLPRLIGPPKAIEMICSGDPVDAATAAELGIVFDAVPSERLLDEGLRVLEMLRSSDEWKQRREERRGPIRLCPDAAAFMFATAEGGVLQKTKGQFPAPLAALGAIREGAQGDLDQGFAVERDAFLGLIESPIAANLMAIFFMDKRLQRDIGVDAEGVIPEKVSRVGVVGAGLMGSGIAAACARRGLPTTMVDVEEKALGAGLGRIQEVIASRIRIGRATPEDMASALALLSTSTTPANVAGSDVVIEAVVEREEVKRELYQRMKQHLGPNTILASNTSTIAISTLAESAPSPERFVGMHFFNPVDRMALVEVIRGKETSDQTVATIVALAKRIKKTPIVVRDCAGFLVNRVLFPYLSEAVLLWLEGAAMDDVDRCATSFGMPMGPFLLHDVVGLDTAFYASGVMNQAYPDRSVKLDVLADLVKAGHLGQKTGRGFRKHEGRKRKPSADAGVEAIRERHQLAQKSFAPEEMTDRLFLPMLLEATRALEEEIVREPGDVDMGLILGTGFPPTKGGILRWCDTVGAGEILARVERLEGLGKRFEPTDTLRELARTGGRFYPLPKRSG
ncbi:Fatty acid oxidation complex subunit alpha [Planctomycetes bacterium Pan216]|uniref:Fatty acid oxidation complex subunit alpha n=1 Tax=Kolteria novifilia TaxID=2527975 RepID=A0A518B8E3_9BACT|nr:Fatty acid oxidation complex subunit alpha [Planctomycetes bacterium Pan216]